MIHFSHVPRARHYPRPYKITAKIGEDGMTVPEAFTQDPDRLARLEREVRQSVRRDVGCPVDNSCRRLVAAGG